MNDVIPETIRKSLEQIRLDNTSGSVQLAKKSAELLNLLIEKTNNLGQIYNLAYLLVTAQPVMASIFNLVNNLMLNIDKNKYKLPENIVHNYCKKFIQDLEISDESISKQSMELIKNNSTIIIHSYSSTVLNTLLFAKKSGKKFSVICTESRPKNEGIQLAKKLGKKGINVKLIVDFAVFSFLLDADMILVGGDAITDTELINKIGTKGLAMAAQHYNTPIYALCSTIKFLPKNYQVTINKQKNPKEIIKSKISNVTPINYYFDFTPLEFLTGIVTENKILKPPEIKERIKNLKIHNSFFRNHLKS
jgi:translation initiation factor 2B subunit (eIF-2B alpha/beta/delta family)